MDKWQSREGQKDTLSYLTYSRMRAMTQVCHLKKQKQAVKE